MVPQRRLATLLDQARAYQAQSCIYHSEVDAPSLYLDHECKPGQFPSVTTHILADHTNEVWRIEWNPDGTLLASASKDRQVVIWQLEVRSQVGSRDELTARRSLGLEGVTSGASSRSGISKTIANPSMFLRGHLMAKHWSQGQTVVCISGI